MRIQVSSGISASEAAQINGILSANFPGTSVQVAVSESGDGPEVANRNACVTACNLAESVAVAACNGIGNPFAKALCIAAAQAAGNACRNAC